MPLAIRISSGSAVSPSVNRHLLNSKKRFLYHEEGGNKLEAADTGQKGRAKKRRRRIPR